MGCGSSNQSYTSSQDDRSIEDYDTPENDFEEVPANLNNEERHYIPLPGVILNMTPDVVANVPSKRDNDDEYDNPPHHSRPSKSQTHNHRRRKSSSRRPRRSDQSYNHLTYVALFDYKARLNADMSFRKGDLLEIVDDKDGEDWRMAKLFSSGDMGLVPSVYIALNGSLDSKDWFFDRMTRREAETLLMSNSNRLGTFMIRRSEKNSNLFSLSIKCQTYGKDVHVKHFRTRYDPENKYCLFPGRNFDSLIKLVEFYATHKEPKLPAPLNRPCPKPIPQLWDLAPELAEQWEISRSELKKIKEVGEGQFGKVWYGKWNKTIEVAIKSCKKGSMTTEEFLREAAIMKKYRYPRLVALYAVCTHEDPIYIVTEFMKYGNLLDYLKNYKKNITFNILIYIALQIAEGMRYLEANKLVHRDLAARNILIGENNSAKISDFGLARVISTTESKRHTKPEMLPVKWTAPEALDYNMYSTKSDVWSFGIVMMELFTYGAKPYGDWTPVYAFMKVKNGYRMERPTKPNMPQLLYDTIRKCWMTDPEDRPTFVYLTDYFEAYTVGNECQYHDEESEPVYVNQLQKTKRHHRK